MKLRIHFILIFYLLFTGCSIFDSSDNIPTECNFTSFKYYQGEKDTLGEMSHNYVHIGIDSLISDQEIRDFVSNESSFEDGYEFKIWKYPHYSKKQTVLKFSESLSCESISAKIEDFEKVPLIDYAHFTMQTDGCRNLIGWPIGEKCINTYSSLFYVQVKDTTDISSLEKTAIETNTNILKTNRFMRDWYTLTADKNSMGDALQMANYFFETGLFRASEPDIIKLPVEGIIENSAN